ncbi:MAG: 50S ribosomal protein L4 [Dehalococcoidia bacterium]|nr:50S ribosomal protein L4 [Dehalococcoidia bacterium]
MELPVRDITGKAVGAIELADDVFGLRPNLSALHQTFVAQMANRRSGIHETKTRGQVRGSTVKIRPQKGSGNARQGSIRAPHHTGGGVVFGPHSRSYAQALPRQVRRLAIRSALSSKARDGELIVLDNLAFTSPRTRDMAALLNALGQERSAIIVTAEPDANVKRSVANLPRVLTMATPYLNVADMMNYHTLVMTQDAVHKAELLWGGERAKARRAPLPGGAR